MMLSTFGLPRVNYLHLAIFDDSVGVHDGCGSFFRRYVHRCSFCLMFFVTYMYSSAQRHACMHVALFCDVFAVCSVVYLQYTLLSSC